MIPAPFGARGRDLLVLAVTLLVGCHARENEFFDEVFPCDVRAGDAACGTTRSGQPMTCFAAGQLGGEDFCTPACDPGQPAEDPKITPRVTCLAVGALLRVCSPTQSETNPALGCPAGLECYRTDLFSDTGVCVRMHVCSQDGDCPDSKRPVCAATLVRELAGNTAIAVDHLQCMQRMCDSGGAACQEGESCLFKYYPSGTVLRDLCVPNCSGDLQCPPNYACAVTPASLGEPSVCFPGVPGVRCTRDQDCLVGDCLDTGAGFSECTIGISCASDADCAYLTRDVEQFVCAEGVPGAGRRCVLRHSFAGASCADSSDCPDGLQCFHFSATMVNQGFGECRVPCGADLRCPVRGGIPHVCLDGGNGGCYPSGFALPCSDDADCLSEFTCQVVSPDERTLVKSPSICTRPCAEDDDCGKSALAGGGFCKEGLCRAAGPTGVPCDRNMQCSSLVCSFDANGIGQCAE